MMVAARYAVLIVVVVLGVWLGSSSLVAADTCYAPSALNFTSERGSLWLNGQAIKLKGASWFGFETSANVVHGLWQQTWSFLLNFLSNNKFNIIRV
jgi:endoglucanase